MVTGIIVGYDPGGNGCHGVAIFHVRDGQAERLVASSMQTAEEVIQELQRLGSILAIGVDTLTCWSTGKSAWRPADRWLRQRYPMVRLSVASPNSLYGSMGLNGMAVLLEVRRMSPSAVITETHPKVLYREMTGRTYDYAGHRDEMNSMLADALDTDVRPVDEHQWDASISALAAFRGIHGKWSRDLHQLPTEGDERLVWPCGKTQYYWPD